MRIKLLGAGEALDGGVAQVRLGDARSERPISRTLDGAGTRSLTIVPRAARPRSRVGAQAKKEQS
jgi:hypothetical protein